MNTLPAKLCDVCKDPGACCREIPLSAVFWDDEDINIEWPRRRDDYAAGPNGHMPFTPIRKDLRSAGHVDPATGRTYSQWLFSCSALQPDGRCGVYLTRPFCCSSYRAGSDRLCAMYRPELHQTSSMGTI